MEKENPDIEKEKDACGGKRERQVGWQTGRGTERARKLKKTEGQATRKKEGKRRERERKRDIRNGKRERQIGWESDGGTERTRVLREAETEEEEREADKQRLSRFTEKDRKREGL